MAFKSFLTLNFHIHAQIYEMKYSHNSPSSLSYFYTNPGLDNFPIFFPPARKLFVSPERRVNFVTSYTYTVLTLYL